MSRGHARNPTLGATVEKLRELATPQGHPPLIDGEVNLLGDMAFFSGQRAAHYSGEDGIWTIATPDTPHNPLLIAVHERRKFDPNVHTDQLPIDLYRLTHRGNTVHIEQHNALVDRTNSDYTAPELVLTCRGLARLGPPDKFSTLIHPDDVTLDGPVPTGAVLARASRLRPIDRYASLRASQDQVTQGQRVTIILRRRLAELLGVEADYRQSESHLTRYKGGLSIAAYNFGATRRREINQKLLPILDLPAAYHPVEDPLPETDFALVVDRPADPHVIYLDSHPATAVKLSFRHTDDMGMMVSYLKPRFLYDMHLAGRTEYLTDQQLAPYAEDLNDVA